MSLKCHLLWVDLEGQASLVLLYHGLFMLALFARKCRNPIEHAQLDNVSQGFVLLISYLLIFHCPKLVKKKSRGSRDFQWQDYSIYLISCWAWSFHFPPNFVNNRSETLVAMKVSVVILKPNGNLESFCLCLLLLYLLFHCSSKGEK